MNILLNSFIYHVYNIVVIAHDTLYLSINKNPLHECFICPNIFSFMCYLYYYITETVKFLVKIERNVYKQDQGPRLDWKQGKKD